MKVKMPPILSNFWQKMAKFTKNNYYRGLATPLFLLAFLFTSLINANLISPAKTSVPADSAPSSLAMISEKIAKAEVPEKSTTTLSQSYQSATRQARAVKSTMRSATATATSITTASATTQTGASSYIAINGQTSPIFISSSTSTNAGKSVGLYNGKFLYGHRHSSVFGKLASLGAGSTFTVTLNGQTSSYRVAGKVTLDKETTQKYMYSLAVLGSYQGVSYDYVLMTCAGESLGNGDATHREIVFANKI